MTPETLVGKIKSLVRTGQTNGRPWAIVRFRDMWKAGLSSVRRDKLEAALNQVLADSGIKVEPEEEGYIEGYAMFVSAKGDATIYVGRTEITDWVSTGNLFEAVQELINSPPTMDLARE